MRALASTKTTDNSAAHRVGHSRGSEETTPIFTPATSSVFPIQRKASCACGGGCPACQSKPVIQAKLSVSEPGDIYEQEADRIADQVMRMPHPALARLSIDPTSVRALSLQRECATCEDEELRRKSQDLNTETPSSGLDLVAATLRQGGQPLDNNTRAFFEPRFGTDFSAVRIHTDNQAAESARSVYALAYTVGRDVVFAAGEHNPGTESGKRLLAHELTHVVQQSSSEDIRLDHGDEIRGLSSIYTPSSSWASQVRGRTMREAGEPFDSGTASLTQSRFGFDFSQGRVHSNDSADQSVDDMSTRAYYGQHMFLRQGQHVPRSNVLRHDLGHVVEHSATRTSVTQAPSVMREPAASAPSPATYIIVYGSGRMSPATIRDHNVEGAFKKAATAKHKEITARLGKAAAQNNIVLKYTPTEIELKAVLNKKYALPVMEIHIFSHGWKHGINLGGPDPGMGKKGSEEKPEERKVAPEELGDYDVQWGDQPNIVLYGCNTGNPAGAPAFAQSVSDAFGVPVRGPTTSSHFDFGGPFGATQVPDKPGKMQEYMPTPAEIESHMKEVERIVNLIALKMKAKGGLPFIIKSIQDAFALREQVDSHVKWLNRVLGDSRFSISDRSITKTKLASLVQRADAALRTP